MGSGIPIAVRWFIGLVFWIGIIVTVLPLQKSREISI